MSSGERIHADVLRLVRTKPFQPFTMTMENGDVIVVEQSENIAFDPVSPAGAFYLFWEARRIAGTFRAVTNVAVVDCGEQSN
ncbi:MAG: hypothetical protein WD851_21630 [Pirellulales bacterium]